MDLFFDIGSTNIKWSAGGETRFAPFPQPVRSDPPYFEVNAEEIADVVTGVIDTLSPDRVFFSVQMHGYVLFKEGREATPYVSWRDTRGRDRISSFRLGAEYGVRIKPNLPRLSLQTQSRFDEFCTLGSYLARKLTGNNATHITDAAPSGFFNATTGRTDECSFRLPKALLRVEAVGKYRSSVVYAPMGDQQCAVLGAIGGRKFGGYILNLGTAAQLCCLSEEFVSGEFESRPFFGGETLCTVTGLPGGAVISARSDGELIQTLKEEYGGAVKKLPARKGFLVTGGVVRYRRKLLGEVLCGFGDKIEYNAGCDALDGLKIISENVK